MSMWSTNPILSMMNKSLINLPTPTNISLMWNYGSLLGLCLFTQITTGLFLSMHYSPCTMMAFDSISHITRDVNMGWMMKSLHANGANLFFICMFIHIARGIYFSSYIMKETWIIGVLIFLISMLTAFLGYVLPWGQMSYWGATVITNLMSAIPYVNSLIITWLWGGFSIDSATLNRFYSFHFTLPFMIAAMVIIHLMFLHKTGSSNPLGINSNLDKMPFYPYFMIKDLMGFSLLISFMFLLIMFFPSLFSDPENFTPANPLNTPIHIQPEWYFLFAYAILRAIPNKLGGVCALGLSILILMTLPLTMKPMVGSNSSLTMKMLYWFFIMTFIMLTWVGSKPVEEPFVVISQFNTTSYFSYFILLPLLTNNTNKL